MLIPDIVAFTDVLEFYQQEHRPGHEFSRNKICVWDGVLEERKALSVIYALPDACA
jgi:hypothetical protein